MKKIALSALLLSSILYGSNNVSKLEQAIKDSDFRAFKALVTKAPIDTNEHKKIVTLSKKIVKKRKHRNTIISPILNQIIPLSIATLFASFPILQWLSTSKTEHSKIEDSFWRTMTIAGNIINAFFIGISQGKREIELNYKLYDSIEIRNMLLDQQPSDNDNNEIVA